MSKSSNVGNCVRYFGTRANWFGEEGPDFQLPVPSLSRSNTITGFTARSLWNFRTPPGIDHGSMTADRLSMLIMSGTLLQGALATFRFVSSIEIGLPQATLTVPMETRRSKALLA